MAASFRKTPVLKSLFNLEYYEIFKSTYFEEHIRTAASENVFMKLRKFVHKEFFFLITGFSTSISETSENACFYLAMGFP